MLAGIFEEAGDRLFETLFSGAAPHGSVQMPGHLDQRPVLPVDLMDSDFILLAPLEHRSISA